MFHVKHFLNSGVVVYIKHVRPVPSTADTTRPRRCPPVFLWLLAVLDSALVTILQHQ